jgi:UDP-N-acetylmuramoyl-L-alanyl-D-glutamate--2,6-diaminopimelate ligase
MAEASEQYSDFTIVTSDNPRSEDPAAITQAIIKGFKKKNSYAVEIDRRLAIQKAIEMASVDDIILIAGKGHETYQIFAHKTIEFDDCKVAYDLCSQIKSKRDAEG